MSAVILAVIVIMWAVVLVPMWLRRHDAATESRSVDRFSAAMRVLSRRQPAGSATARYVLMPRRESAASVHVSGAAAPRRVEAPAAAARRREAAPRRKASLAVRRRRVLFGLLGAAFFTTVLAVAGVIGFVLPVVVYVLTVAFVVHLRTQAKRSAALARQRRRTAAAAPALVVTEAPVEVAFEAPPVTPTAARYAAQLARPSAPSAPAAEAVPMPAEVVAEDIPVSAEATGTDDASAWEPVPVPRPTYTMKPPAPPRHYPPVQPDFDSEYESDEVPVGDETVAAQAPPRVEADDDGQLDEILTHRWAVND